MLRINDSIASSYVHEATNKAVIISHLSPPTRLAGTWQIEWGGRVFTANRQRLTGKCIDERILRAEPVSRCAC